MKIDFKWLFALALTAATLYSCVEENISVDPKYNITFSCDTIMFDTLFAEQSSPTKTLLIHNHNKYALKIDKILLGKGAASRFRYNVDGRIAPSGGAIEDIVIKAKDSLYLFVETTPAPTESAELLNSDSLIFLCNGHLSDVKLFSIGRRARVLRNYSTTPLDTFDSSLPYLVFGWLHVPQGVQLKLREGTQLYMHGGANIIVDGELNSLGTQQNPVVIRGDRFDFINDVDQTPYDQMPNQWGSIYLQNAQASHLIDHTIIRGGGMGIILVGASRSNPSLHISNSVIHNMSLYGIYSQMAQVRVENCEISNCGESCVALIGGEGYFAHTTVANYYRFGQRKSPAFFVANYVMQGAARLSFPISSVVVENSILFGANSTELVLQKDTITNTDFNVLLSYCLIKDKKQENQHFANCLWASSRNIKNATDTVFVNTSVANISETGYYNFRLDTLSKAIGRASMSVSTLYPLDLDGVSRTADGYPDLGAYERASSSAPNSIK